MSEEITPVVFQTTLISLKETARRLAVSQRWLRDHWQENGGTKAFGAIKFFEDLVNARLSAEHHAADLLLQDPLEAAAAERERWLNQRALSEPGFERARGGGRNRRGPGSNKSGVISNRHGVFDDPPMTNARRQAVKAV